MKTSATNRFIREFLTALEDETLQPRPDFQRRLVWANKDKVEFIRTVLDGYPFPEVYVATGDVDTRTGKGNEMLVDGQQRITTLDQYFKGSPDLKLPDEIKPYAALATDTQLAFLEYEVVTRNLGKKPIEEIKDIFRRINSTSYGLNAMEIRNARYAGELKEFAVDFAEHPFLEENRLFSLNDARRMNDVRFCLSLIITLLSNYFNRDKELEAYLERYNESFPAKHQISGEIESVFGCIGDLGFPRSSRAFKKADFFTLFVEIHRLMFKDGKSLDIAATADSLSEFYRIVDGGKDGKLDEDTEFMRYYKAALNATNDRSSRIARGEVLRERIVVLE